MSGIEDMQEEIRKLQEQNTKLEQENKIYKEQWIDLCDKIIEEVDKDGWCRLIVTKEEALEMKSFVKMN